MLSRYNFCRKEHWLNLPLDKINNQIIFDEIDPVNAYEKLVGCEKSFLIDVRSKAEWNFVGIPYSLDMKNEVIFCEWSVFPNMIKNSNFIEELISKIDFKQAENLYFICRSGARSFQAAKEVQNTLQKFYKEFGVKFCLNVRYGFEGDLSEDSKRGNLNGWKYSNLPWMQL